MMDLLKPNINPIRIYNWLNNLYGKKWFLDWEQETLLKEFQSEKIKHSPENLQKIYALRTLMLTEMPWKEWEAFEKVTLALNDILPSFAIMEDITPQQMAFCVEILSKIKSKNEFSIEVKKYIAAKCFEKGLVYLEVPLNIAMVYMKQLMENRPMLQLLSDDVRKNRNVQNIKNSMLKFQISELNTIAEYLRRRNAEQS